MLESSTTKDDSAVERLFCVPFKDLPKRPMTNEEKALFLALTNMEKENGVMLEFDISDQEVPMSLRILQKSIEHRFNFKMTDSLKLMISSLCKSAGEVIMYLTFLQYCAKTFDKKELGMIHFYNIFPDGEVPTTLEDIWRKQKVKRSENNPHGSDNLLDYPFASKTILF